jgi:hypothetical protein
MKAKKDKTEKEVKLIIVRRHEPDEFTDLMLRLAPVFSVWQATTRKHGKDNKSLANRGNKP